MRHILGIQMLILFCVTASDYVNYKTSIQFLNAYSPALINPCRCDKMGMMTAKKVVSFILKMQYIFLKNYFFYSKRYEINISLQK